VGFGVGGWGAGAWGWGPTPQAPIPNPQSPIPNPHMKNLIHNFFKLLKLFIYINYY